MDQETKLKLRKFFIEALVETQAELSSTPEEQSITSVES